MARFDRREVRRLQRGAGQRRNFARDAEHGQAMAQVRRQLEREDMVVQPHDGTQVLAQGRICAQFEQPAVVLAEVQFARRTEHPLAFDASQLAHADPE